MNHRYVLPGLAVLTVSLSFLSNLWGADAPSLPPNLEWHSVPEIKGKLLVPSGWDFSQGAARSSGEKQYRITKKPVEANGSFETGVVLTVKVHSKHGSAEEQAQAFVREYLEKGTVVEPFFEEDFGPMKAYGGMVSSAAGGHSVTYALNAVANPQTNTLYLFVFQSPTETFGQEWELGKWLIGRFKLDDDI